MPGEVQISIDLKGPFFEARIDEATKRVIYDEVIDKVEQRWRRQPRSPKPGRKNNTLSYRRSESRDEVILAVDTTLNRPRTTGSAWVKYWAGSEYNQGVIRRLATNVIRKAGKRIAAELGGS